MRGAFFLDFGHKDGAFSTCHLPFVISQLPLTAGINAK